jgi:hypothetical protein
MARRRHREKKKRGRSTAAAVQWNMGDGESFRLRPYLRRRLLQTVFNTQEDLLSTAGSSEINNGLATGKRHTRRHSQH